ncbi:uncharacterized protein [Spinacia oleracea]|uniref:RNase H type-1 domain-containing protein n=1 Tax=Spinacia oleracea TaxID=3562 RepID=A0A9R0KBH7_SPIOL|nr:uncharacterized protein LOC110804434 [Spinacia oleracea]
MVAWSVWNERNRVIHGREARLPAEVVAATSSLLVAFTQVREECTVRRGEIRRAREEAKWRPPDDNVLKLNVDGATYKEGGVGMRVIIRDNGGTIVRAVCQQVRQSWDANVTEAKSIILGLKMALQCNASKVVVECDYLQVVELINRRKFDGSYFGMLSREINAISSSFDVILFCHVYREANLAADVMAQLSPLEYSTRVWVGSCPSVVEDVIASDFCFNVNES